MDDKKLQKRIDQLTRRTVSMREKVPELSSTDYVRIAMDWYDLTPYHTPQCLIDLFYWKHIYEKILEQINEVMYG